MPPEMISFISVGFAYSVGLIADRAFPALIRGSLMSVVMAPKVGAKADVPYIVEIVPSRATTSFAPLAETSG